MDCPYSGLVFKFQTKSLRIKFSFWLVYFLTFLGWPFSSLEGAKEGLKRSPIKKLYLIKPNQGRNLFEIN